MADSKEKKGLGLSDILSKVGEALEGLEVNLENLCVDDDDSGGVKVVCMAPGLGDSFNEMGQKPRSETVMVRIDEETRQTLDAWVETDYFKSRSEAAALFIREGLKVRSSELEKIREAINEVERAKQNLRDKAKNIFGGEGKE
jgi:Arc/MetJ-type ribon-helix-helix transcriptional regulator